MLPLYEKSFNNKTKLKNEIEKYYQLKGKLRDQLMNILK